MLVSLCVSYIHFLCTKNLVLVAYLNYGEKYEPQLNNELIT